MHPLPAFANLNFGMWDLTERFSASTLEKLPSAGFAVGSTRGVMRVEKYGCGAELRKTPDGSYQMTIMPAVLINEEFVRLWDAGYQKFFLSDDGRKLPALAAQLADLRLFNEELRTALGVPTYYNEGLGSTCQRTVYDRLQGRPGGEEEDPVGANAAGER